MAKIEPTDEELRPYGYRPGDFLGWCEACARPIKNVHPQAFKCRPCATEQWRDVERICKSVDLPANYVPEKYKRRS